MPDSRITNTLACRAYEAYLKDSGGVSLATGAKLPEWDALPEEIQSAWRAAASTVYDITLDACSKQVVELFIAQVEQNIDCLKK